MKSYGLRSEGSLPKTNSSGLFHLFFLSFIGLVCLRIFIFAFQPSSNNADCLYFFTLPGDKWTPVLISPLSSYGPVFRLEFHISNQRLPKKSANQRVFCLYFPPTHGKIIMFTQCIVHISVISISLRLETTHLNFETSTCLSHYKHTESPAQASVLAECFHQRA